ncbi:SAV_2336 N-terminal domain-related protein [Streptomyces griseochromogenes]|uniref:SAV_2336 N-terminal domain-related protein n=1 Tax=Streptomyces griseochromogenes TaxID=68214 RepID=UPI0037A4E4B3
MLSDRPAAAAPLARLADVLAKATGGVRPTPLELAELLWLARQMEPAEGEGGGAVPAPAEPAPAREHPLPEPPAPDPPAPAPDEPSPASPEPEPPRAPLHLPSPTAAPGPYASLLAPAPPMLRHPLGLQRSLRPLKRRTDAPVGLRFDEHATADRIARLGAAPEWWLPVLRPARERWLRLNLVYDTGPTMPVWRPLIRELHTALAQSGVFRTVAVYRAGPDGSVRGDGAYPPGDGRTVTLLISDCMGPQWRPGEAGTLWYDTLRRWAHQMPLAVVQPLPEHLWRDTALPAEPGLLSAPFPAAPTATLTFTPYEEEPPQGAIPLPVLEPGPRWLANWAGLVASMGGSPFPGSAALLGQPLDLEGRTDVALLPAEELVLRFRATASPEAFRLAGHLAVGRPDLPVMRLVQRAVEPDPRPQHLAEVILSGVLTAVPGPPGSYRFRPGARELLLRGLPRAARTGTTELLRRVGGLIEERAGAAPGEFRAVMPDAAGSTEADGEAFATVRPESVRRLTDGREAPVPRVLGGRYRLLRRLGPAGSVWLAEDREEPRAVAVWTRRPFFEPAESEAFLRDAARLKALAHRNVVTVHDFGIEDDVPYVVMEHLDGIALNTLAAPNGYRLPPPLTVSIGIQLAHAVKAVHEAGLTHGDFGMSRVMLLPDGTVKLSVFVPGRFSGEAGRDRDLHRLCEVMLLLGSGGARPSEPFTGPQLVHLPAGLRQGYANILNRLASVSLRDQAQGLHLLTDEDLLVQALAAYDSRRSYSVLGPLKVELDHRAAVFGPTELAALAMLLLRHGREVTHEEFRTGLWNRADAPKDVMPVLGAIMNRLRKALGPGALATLPGGYALHASADYVDLVRCEDLERTATILTSEGRLPEARERLTKALGLWHGTGALADVPGPAARTARTRLQQLRLALHRKLAELDLDLGEPERAATQLTDLLRAYPSREDFRRLLLIALRRQGRTEEALEVYEEYELAGGTDPELRALGRELRDEYDEPVDDAPAAEPDHHPLSVEDPHDLPPGSFPTEESLPSIFATQEQDASSVETPLPQDEVPESLFAVEDPLGEVPPWDREDDYDDQFDYDPERFEPPDDEPPPTYLTTVTFQLADAPEDADTVAALGRAVTRLLTGSGLSPDAYELSPQDDGYSVVFAPEVSVLPLLSLMSLRFQDELVLLGGHRWLVTFSCFHEDGRDPEIPDPVAVREALDTADDRRGIIAVPQTLRDEWDEDTDEAPRLRPLRPGPASGWYRLAMLPRVVFDGSVAPPPVHGPYPLPGDGLFPRAPGVTRAVVHTLPGGGFSLTRTDRATAYYEVDLTERRLELDVTRPAFRAVGPATWRVTDPCRAVALGSAESVPEAVVGALRARLDQLPYQPDARGALGDGPGPDAVPGVSVRWDLTLTPTRFS